MGFILQKHLPTFNNGILGCDGFTNPENIKCLIADGNKFLSSGIKNGSIVFVDTSQDCLTGELNVFQIKNTYIISNQKEPEQQYIGRVIMALTLYNN